MESTSQNDPNNNGDTTSNYSTILRHDLNTNQIVNLGSLSDNDNHQGDLRATHSASQPLEQTLPNGAAETNKYNNNSYNNTRPLASFDEITESEPSTSRLATLLGQPELIVAEDLPQSSKNFIMRNQQNTGSNYLNNGKVQISPSLPVTSSHLKRPFALTTDDSDGSSGKHQKVQFASTGELSSQAAAQANSNGTVNAIKQQQQQQQQNSIVSPSVISDESLAPPSIVRMHDIGSSVELEQQHHGFASGRNYQESDEATLNLWPNSSNNDEQNNASPHIVYPKAPNRSYNGARFTIGAGNQLAAASSSSLALESSRSTDLSPTNNAEINRQQDIDLGNNQNIADNNNNNHDYVHSSNGNHAPDETVSDTISVNDISSDPNEQTNANELTQGGSSLQRHEAAITINIEKPNSNGNINNTYTTHAQYQRYREQQDQREDQAVRVIEIPEKIMVSAEGSTRNEDPIEIMPAPPAQTPPIRIVVNRTRLGRPDPRCPKEGVSTFEHPSACDKYYYCDDGYLIEQICPNGLMYGTMYRVKDYCVYRWHADCVDKSIPDPVSSPGCRWQYGIFSVQGSPRCTPDYYECIAGRFEVKKCSITGQVYDDRSKGCQYAEKVGCPEEIISDFQCPTDDRTNSFWPFPRYYLDSRTIIHCVNDKPKIMRCPEGERVDLEHLYCIPMGSNEPVVMDRKVRERQKGTMQPQGKN